VIPFREYRRYSMSWLVMSFFLSLGTLSYNGSFLSPEGMVSIVEPPNTFATTLGVEAQLLDNHAFVGASIQTWESVLGNGFFSPSESLYIFNAGFRLNGFEIGWRHECDHITLATMSLPSQGFGENRDDIYVSYHANIKVF
jgi:hypothetical protein